MDAEFTHQGPPPSKFLLECLATLREHEAELRAEGVIHVGIFGSVARGDNNKKSDIDVIIYLPEDSNIGILDIIGIGDSLTDIFKRPVDVVTKRSLRSPRHDRILSETVRAF